MADKSSGKAHMDGMMEVARYDVFPGIVLEHRTAWVKRLKTAEETKKSVFEISHCGEGRIEFSHDGEFYYLAPGDLSISRKSAHIGEMYFPEARYRGITVVIDLEMSPESLSSFMDDVDVRPEKIIEKFCSNKDYYISRSDQSIEHIFSELYHVPDHIKAGYFKVKVLELLMFLAEMQPADEKQERQHFTRSQVLLAKGVCEYLIQNMDRHITIEKLAEAFHISGTQLKNTFKGVYGTSIYSYIRSQKMQAAGRMLREGNDTILEIAGTFGYENGSKFAKAFRDTMGMSPKAYRNAPEEKIKSVFLE